jgi:hypothetical protein
MTKAAQFSIDVQKSLPILLELVSAREQFIDQSYHRPHCPSK